MKVFKVQYKTSVQRWTLREKGLVYIWAADVVEARTHLRFKLGNELIFARNPSLLKRTVSEAIFTVLPSKDSKVDGEKVWDYGTGKLIVGKDCQPGIL